MSTSATLSFIAWMFAMTLVISCSQSETKNTNAKPTVAPPKMAATAFVPVSSPASPVIANAPPVSRVKSLPPEGGDKPTQAETQGYTYSYKTDGAKTDAMFEARLLPADIDIVAGAIRDIIYRSYGDRVNSDPHIEGTGPARTIHIAGKKHQYLIVPVSEPTGEIHSLIITQMN